MLLSAHVRANLRFLRSNQCAGSCVNDTVTHGFVDPIVVCQAVCFLITRTSVSLFAAKK